MARKKNDVPENVQPVRSKFDPASLTWKEAGLVIEHYLGLHPNYFIYEHSQIKVNYGAIVADRVEFDAFLPHLVELNHPIKDDYQKRFK